MSDLFNGFVEAVVKICHSHHSLSLIARNAWDLPTAYPSLPQQGGADHQLQKIGMLISIPSSFSNKLTWYCNHKSSFGTRKTLRSMVYSIWWSDCWFQSIWINMFVIIPVIWLNINLKQVFEIIWTCLKPRESHQILMYKWLFLYVSFRANFPIISEKNTSNDGRPLLSPACSDQLEVHEHRPWTMP